MFKKITAIIVIIAVISVMVLVFSNSISADVVVKTYEANQLLKETNFDSGNGLPWHICETAPADADFEIKNGKYYVTINKLNPNGGERWDIQFRHRDLFVQNGHTYTVKFTVTASNSCQIYPKIGDQGDPYYEDWNINKNWEKLSLSANQAKTYSATFTANRTAEVLEFAFHLAEAPEGTVFTFDNMSLTDPQFSGHPDETIPDYREIRVNQLGYFPNRQKLATLNANETSPVEWRLVNSSGTEVASGMTKVFGKDNDSGENVHIIDFTSFNTVGSGYKLYADSKPVLTGSDSEADSYPFDIAANMYDSIVYDSLKYFYHSRSGIEIKMPYCNESQWARRAGHTSDVMTTSKESGGWAYPDSYTVDVTGGWYDAGDHGKYVVNGGITVWTLQNLYERKLINGQAPEDVGDDTMNIPESGNGYPDILDEARWHMEAMLKMQVPAGKSRAGMVFHKGHDITWTGLAIEPADDPKERILKPPTTAATLNFAATAAQSYRLWSDYDQSFANKCLSAAEVAWEAALDNPAIYAPFDEAVGGGPYGDDYVEDEFYWAACELLAATGKSEYLDFVKSSPHYLECPNYLERGEEQKTVGQFNWGNTAALGTITLSLIPNEIGSEEMQKARDNIMAAGDFTLGVQDKQGYGITIAPSPVLDTGLTGYPWGSNSFVTNSCIVLAYAYDYSKDAKYLDGVTEAMDYMMGRNPNERAYITGYGDYPIKYPHHRFFSNQVDSSFPLAPPGITNGGPNSGLQDPWVMGSGWKAGDRAPQKCFMDHIESWSTNECTINWNAPMAWVTSFLSDNGNNTAEGNPDPVSPPPTVSRTTTSPSTTRTSTRTTAITTSAPRTTSNVTTSPTSTTSYSVDYTMNDWGSGATVAVKIKNNGSSAISNWTLTFSFAGNQKITNLWNGSYTQSGSNVTITPAAYNSTIPAGGNVEFGFNLSYSGSNAKPTNFTLK